MRVTRQQLIKLIREAMEVDLEIGDVILTGKFKNKRKVVKDFGKDDFGQPTINGLKALSFRIEKLMSKDKWSKESKEALEFAEGVNEVKITKRQLRNIIKEERGRLAGAPHFNPESPGPLEYKLVDLITSAWQQDVLSQDFEGTGPSWKAEVEEAAVQIEEALMDAGVLDSVLSLLSTIEEKLHNGEYA